MVKLRKLISEKIILDIEIGDTILGGRFRNRKILVKDIGKNELGQPTVNGKTILKVKIPKMYPTELKVNECMKKSELIQLIEAIIKKEVDKHKIKRGDKVYWKMRVGMYYRTMSGRVESIKGDWLTIVVNTQNSGGRVRKKENEVTKNKIQ